MLTAQACLWAITSFGLCRVTIDTSGQPCGVSLNHRLQYTRYRLTLKAYAYGMRNATQVHTYIERLALALNGHAVTMRAGDMRMGGVVAGFYGVNVTTSEQAKFDVICQTGDADSQPPRLFTGICTPHGAEIFETHIETHKNP